MDTEEVAKFLDDHPDWSPLLDDSEGRVAGFRGPQGGEFTIGEVRALLLCEREQREKAS